MDPLRRRFFVNGAPVAGSVLHAQYLKPVAKLLDAVKYRMQMGNLQQLAQRYITEDGATLTAMSRFGQDEIRIDVPFRQGVVVTNEEVTTIETPEFVRKLRVMGYTVWVVDGPGTGVVEYDDAGQLTGRAFPDLVNASNGHITSLIYAHNALWVGFLNGTAVGVLRINDASGEVASVGPSAAIGIYVALTATRTHVLALYDNDAGTPAVLARMTPAGEADGQGSGEYSANTSAIFADDRNIYIVGGGGMTGFGWQSSGIYVKTLDMETLAGSTVSFTNIPLLDASGTTSSFDAVEARVLASCQDTDGGTYQDWQIAGGALESIDDYGFDWLIVTDPWVTCGETLLKLRYTGAMDVQRGSAAPAPIPSYYAVYPVWDGDGAVWMVLYQSGVDPMLVRYGFDGAVMSVDMPPNTNSYQAPSPAIQLQGAEITLPAAEATDDPIDELPARELRILRSRAGWN